MNEMIFTPKATPPTAPYSQAIKVGNTVYLAGACGDDPKTGKIIGNGDIKAEATATMENLKATIEAAGGTMNNLVMVHVYVKDISFMKAFNEVYPRYFKDAYLPARIAVQVSAFAGDGINMEVDAIAVLPEK